MDLLNKSRSMEIDYFFVTIVQMTAQQMMPTDMDQVLLGICKGNDHGAAWQRSFYANVADFRGLELPSEKSSSFSLTTRECGIAPKTLPTSLSSAVVQR